MYSFCTTCKLGFLELCIYYITGGALTQYESCLKCTPKVLVEAGKPGLDRCGKCGMLQRVDASAKQWSATCMVKAGQRVKVFGSEQHCWQR